MSKTPSATATAESVQRRISLALIVAILGLSSALCWMLGLNHRTGPDSAVIWLLLGLPWAGLLLSLGYLLRYGTRGRKWPWLVWGLCLLLAVLGAAMAVYVYALGSAWKN